MLQEVQKKTSLDLLLEMPAVQGNELDTLLGDFHGSVASVVGNPNNWDRFMGVLKGINPNYTPSRYSNTPEANLLANVVAAYYGPLIHGFSNMVLKNIESTNLSEFVLAPPRDAIPIATSLNALAKLKSQKIKILNPPVNRNITGVVNNQTKMVAKQDPLFGALIDQEIVGKTGGKLVEVEFGIYSTTSLIMAKHLSEKETGLNFVPLKFYGLGPNLSYVHALHADGAEWIAEKAENQGLVAPATIANLMVLIDSLEEFGMQNMYKSVRSLTRSGTQILPIFEPVSSIEREIAVATNLAIELTASTYSDVDAPFVLSMLGKVDELVKLAKSGYPTILKSAIPPMDAPLDHFAEIRKSSAFHYPNLYI